tara:strand:+ start:921 stop:1178 length:258 start_codon:yes stop_codon:yes gene_type:complete
MKIEEFYNTLPWQIKENAKFPLNYTRLTSEQELLIESLFDYEKEREERHNQVSDILSDTGLIERDAQEVVSSIKQLQKSLKKVAE